MNHRTPSPASPPQPTRSASPPSDASSWRRTGDLARALDAPASTLSAALAQLSAAGIVVGAREGRVVRYRADMPGVRRLLAFLMEDCCGGDPELCRPALDALEDC